MRRHPALAIVLTLAATACGPDACRMAEEDAGPAPGEDAGVADPFHDPLATPQDPTLFVGNFTESVRCGDCHENHYQQWRTSNHSYATVDPVWRALVLLRQQEFDGAQDQFCVQCHSPVATRGGEITDNFSFDGLSSVFDDGVSCETCHKGTHVQRPYNAGLVIDEFSPMRGPIEDPSPSAFHASEYDPLFERSSLCASCHDVVEVSGLNLERPYAEWLESPARRERKTCQHCHMPTYRGRATATSPERTLHEHRFVGVDVPLTDSFFADAAERDAHIARVRALLESAASVRAVQTSPAVPGAPFDLVTTVTNDIGAHDFPTGTTFIRQAWLEVVVTDAGGDVVFETGTLDDNGDLRDYWSALDPFGDQDLVSYGSALIDENGSPVLFSWRASEHQTRAIPPGFDRTNTFFVPVPDDAEGPLTASVRLLFRSHAPYLLRALELDPLVNELLIHEVDAVTLAIDLASP